MVTSDHPPAARERALRSLASLKEGSGSRIRVLLADDHAVLRQALRLLLEMADEVDVVGEAADGREAVEAVGKLQPDVVLMDLAMPGLNGVEATRQIMQRHRGVRVLILTGFADEERILEALRAGALGYIIKRSEVTELLLAIQTVHRGNPYVSESLTDGRTVLDIFVRAQQSGRPGAGETLTAREREILQLVAEGHPNQSIAEQLFLSVKTVEAHKAHIMAKLGAQKTTDLIRYAIKKGIITLDSDLDEASNA
jgi:DNA-binding NarL/FixJ family response regulator